MESRFPRIMEKLVTPPVYDLVWYGNKGICSGNQKIAQNDFQTACYALTCN